LAPVLIIAAAFDGTPEVSMLRHRASLVPVLALILVVAGGGGEGWAQEGPALSPRNASYVMAIKLDPASKMMEGRQTITWKNLQAAPTSELWFHLYYNGFRNSRSTWMLGNRLRQRADGDRIHPEDWGWQEVGTIKQVAAAGRAAADLTAGLTFVAPDDANQDDRTVFKVALPAPVAPGESVTVELTFKAKIPRTFARTGFRGDYFFLSHFYPALGVYEQEGWNCHQFHVNTEFFSDYGNYDVSLTVPRGWVVGATGRQADRRDNADGTTTHRYVQADVHNFAWTTSPDYQVRQQRFEHPGLPPVEMRLLIQPEHLHQTDRHFAATRAALANYGTWYGAYPYGHITVIDPAYGSGAGGMEYPTLFTCGTRIFNPVDGGSPEGVTIHEAGHQFWYGIVGNNEQEHAWLDEGFNRFSDDRAYEAAYGREQTVRRYFRLSSRGRGTGGFFPLRFPDLTTDRWTRAVDQYRPAATAETAARPTYLYYPPLSSNITYAKTAVWLMTLERHLGWDTLQKIMSTHFERWKFKHPQPQDFFNIANEVSGQDLTWFFDQVYRGSEAFDYAVESVVSKPAALEGFDGKQVRRRDPKTAKKPAPGQPFRTEVVVRRLGGGVFPVDVLLVFQDGSQVRERWDGKERWRLFVVERPSKLKHAIVDPDHKLVLDINYTNNSRVLEPAATVPVLKWTSKWMVWLQDLLATFAFFS
jgi:hypothetical protein